jgi:hypothetical protein
MNDRLLWWLSEWPVRVENILLVDGVLKVQIALVLYERRQGQYVVPYALSWRS